MGGAIAKAEELKALTHNSVILQQFKNSANPQIHSLTTAKEIISDSDANVDALSLQLERVVHLAGLPRF